MTTPDPALPADAAGNEASTSEPLSRRDRILGVLSLWMVVLGVVLGLVGIGLHHSWADAGITLCALVAASGLFLGLHEVG